MRLIDIIRFKSEWQDVKYDMLHIDFTIGSFMHSADISLRDIRTPWQRFKFALWIFKTLGGKKHPDARADAWRINTILEITK